MAKTALTKTIESILIQTYKREYGCPEVSMGFGTSKDGRVDYLVMDSKGIFRCFEIKVTKADFRSQNINSFEGHYNYYVMPRQLFEEVKEEIPAHVGVFIPLERSMKLENVKPARKQAISDKRLLELTQYLARSLSRDANRFYEVQDDHTVPRLNKKIYELTRDKDMYYKSSNKYYLNLCSLENDLDLIYGENFKEIIHQKAEVAKAERRMCYQRR